MDINWQWARFETISQWALYEILGARQAVFIIEQNCIYQDIDGVDQFAWHLLGWHETSEKRELIAYLRLIDPGVKYEEASFGRLLTMPICRGKGIGNELLKRGIEGAETYHRGKGIRISAQHYLEKYYEKFDFNSTTAIYAEDGIPHVEMFRA